MSSTLRLATSALRPSTARSARAARSVVRQCTKVCSQAHSTASVPPNNSYTSIPTTTTWNTNVVKELDEVLAGRLEALDPKYVDLQKGRPGTRSSPIPVPSEVAERVVGCACGGEETAVQWILVKHGHVNECGSCGNCFELVLQQNDDVTMTSLAST